VEAEPESCDDSAVECNTLLEAAEIAGSDERPLDIVIIPPSGKGAVSDEEIIDKDLSPSALPGQVAGPLVIHFHGDEIPDKPTRKTSKETGRRHVKLQKLVAPKWKCKYTS